MTETLDHKISTVNDLDMQPRSKREFELISYWHNEAHRVLENEVKELRNSVRAMGRINHTLNNELLENR